MPAPDRADGRVERGEVKLADEGQRLSGFMVVQRVAANPSRPADAGGRPPADLTVDRSGLEEERRSGEAGEVLRDVTEYGNAGRLFDRPAA